MSPETWEKIYKFYRHFFPFFFVGHTLDSEGQRRDDSSVSSLLLLILLSSFTFSATMARLLSEFQTGQIRKSQLKFIFSSYLVLATVLLGMCVFSKTIQNKISNLITLKEGGNFRGFTRKRLLKYLTLYGLGLFFIGAVIIDILQVSSYAQCGSPLAADHLPYELKLEIVATVVLHITRPIFSFFIVIFAVKFPSDQVYFYCSTRTRYLLTIITGALAWMWFDAELHHSYEYYEVEKDAVPHFNCTDTENITFEEQCECKATPLFHALEEAGRYLYPVNVEFCLLALENFLHYFFSVQKKQADDYVLIVRTPPPSSSSSESGSEPEVIMEESEGEHEAGDGHPTTTTTAQPQTEPTTQPAPAPAPTAQPEEGVKHTGVVMVLAEGAEGAKKMLRRKRRKSKKRRMTVPEFEELKRQREAAAAAEAAAAEAQKQAGHHRQSEDLPSLHSSQVVFLMTTLTPAQLLYKYMFFALSVVIAVAYFALSVATRQENHEIRLAYLFFYLFYLILACVLIVCGFFWTERLKFRQIQFVGLEYLMLLCTFALFVIYFFRLIAAVAVLHGTELEEGVHISEEDREDAEYIEEHESTFIIHYEIWTNVIAIIFVYLQVTFLFHIISLEHPASNDPQNDAHYRYFKELLLFLIPMNITFWITESFTIINLTTLHRLTVGFYTTHDYLLVSHLLYPFSLFHWFNAMCFTIKLYFNL